MNLLKKIFDRKARLSKEDLHSYLKQTTDKNTTQKVEKALVDSPLLNDAVEGFADFGADEMYNVPSFEQFQVERAEESWLNKNRSWINKILSILLILLLGAAVYLYWQDTQSRNTDRIFATHFNELNDLSIYALRGVKKESEMISLEQKDSIKKQALLDFQRNEIPTAIQGMNVYLDLVPNDLQALFYQGYMHLMQGDAPTAIEYLAPLVYQKTDYKDEIRWYLGLAYVKAKDKESARQILEELSSDGHEFFAKKARAVLELI